MPCVTLLVQKKDIALNCSLILTYCQELLISVKMRQTREKLCVYRDILESTGTIYSKKVIVKEVTDLLSRIHSARKTLFTDGK